MGEIWGKKRGFFPLFAFFGEARDLRPVGTLSLGGPGKFAQPRGQGDLKTGRPGRRKGDKGTRRQRGGPHRQGIDKQANERDEHGKTPPKRIRGAKRGPKIVAV